MPTEHDSAGHVLVTGAGGGIGAAITKRLRTEGWAVSACDLHPIAAPEPTPTGGRVHFADGVDVRDPDSVRRFADDGRTRQGPFTAAVTVAGIQRTGPTLDVGPAAWNDVLAVNLSGTFFAIQAVLDDLLTAGTGRVVTIGSEIGLAGQAEYAAYSASKGGVIAMTKTLAREFASRGIRVNCVAPGPIEAGMLLGEDAYNADWLAANVPLRQWGRPQDVAATVSFLLGDGGAYFTGQVLSPNGGVVI